MLGTRVRPLAIWQQYPKAFFWNVFLNNKIRLFLLSTNANDAKETTLDKVIRSIALKFSLSDQFLLQEQGDEIPVGDHQEGHTIIRQVRDENGDQYEIHQQVQGHPDDMGQVQMEVQNDQMGDHGTKLERIEDDPYAFDDGKI